MRPNWSRLASLAQKLDNSSYVFRFVSVFIALKVNSFLIYYDFCFRKICIPKPTSLILVYLGRNWYELFVVQSDR